MKVYIHPSVTGQSRDELEDLLDEAECEIVEALEDLETEDDAGEEAPVHAEAEEEDVADDDEGAEAPQVAPACVVVLTPGLAEGDLEPELTEAVKRGCRVIGIWGSGADGEGDASPLADYGADTVPWDRARVRDAICGVPQHQGPSGTRMPKPKGTHGGC
ncbi:hypothetical protein SH591_07605 [Sphingomonas sp. LY54]|uniref:hypothetical protein n=1 Tax=Sphingomonas sp. LY54 TaxID=3095343 RepID=UPI002D76DA39|nr:hypothetical protein [Sphingomonas sp. LY54]WRP30027.1 hypothetical protein SH591_07605 [Sphingomonas sp. LY54]